MNLRSIILFLFVLIPVAAADEEDTAVTVVPRFGEGFGKIIEIEGKIVDDRDTLLRSHLGKKLIEVDRVADRKLKKPLVIELSVFSFLDLEIPDRGTRVRFRGYETGGFTGIPKEAFKDFSAVATTSHYFESRFQITRRLTPVEAGQD